MWCSSRIGCINLFFGPHPEATRMAFSSLISMTALFQIPSAVACGTFALANDSSWSMEIPLKFNLKLSTPIDFWLSNCRSVSFAGETDGVACVCVWLE